MESQHGEELPIVECGAIGEGAAKTEETEIEKSKCDSCIFENTEAEANIICMDCCAQLCANCAREHRKNKISRDHKIVEIEDIINDGLAIKTMKKMMTCTEHPENTVTSKCEDHDRYIFAVCLAEFHQKCIRTVDISKVNKDSCKITCKSLMETLSQQKNVITDSKQSSEERRSRFEAQLGQLQTRKEKYFNSLFETLSQAKEKFEADIQALSMKQLNYIERNLQNCQIALDKEQEYKKLLDYTLKFGNPSEMNVIPDLIMAKCNSLTMTVEANDSKKEFSLNFERRIDVSTLEDIGKVYVSNQGEDENSDHYSELCVSSDVVDEIDKSSSSNQNKISVAVCCAPSKCDMSTQTEETPSISLMEGRTEPFGHVYPINSPTDNNYCAIKAIVILPDGRIALIDDRNCCLKVIGEDFSQLIKMNFSDSPMDICHVFDATVAVVFDNVREVVLFEVCEAHILQAGSFQTKFEIVAIAKFGDDDKVAVLFYEHDTLSIQIRDTRNGRILQKYHCEYSAGVDFNFEDHEGNRMVCRGENDILLSVYWKFHCFDIEEGSICDDHDICDTITESWFFKSRRDRILKDITGLATDEEGNVYVCGYQSHNVYQISANDYRFNREIVSNIRSPLSLAVNSKMGYLVIGCEHDDFIHVYQFS